MFDNWNRLVAERQKQLTEQEGKIMTEQAKEARRAYKREWNRRNPDKVKQAQERYWNRKAAQAAAEQEVDETQEA